MIEIDSQEEQGSRSEFLPKDITDLRTITPTDSKISDDDLYSVTSNYHPVIIDGVFQPDKEYLDALKEINKNKPYWSKIWGSITREGSNAITLGIGDMLYKKSLSDSAQRLSSNSYNLNTEEGLNQKFKDQVLIDKYLTKQLEDSFSDYGGTFSEKVIQTEMEVLPFIAELAATGGLLSASKIGLRKILKRQAIAVAEKEIEKAMATGMLKNIGKQAIEKGIIYPLVPSTYVRTARNYYDRKNAEGYQWTDKGLKVIPEKEFRESPAKILMKAFFDTSITYFTEFIGGELVGLPILMGKKGLSALHIEDGIGKAMKLGDYNKALTGRLLSKTKNFLDDIHFLSSENNILKRLGVFHGIIPETSEEFAQQFLNSVFNLDIKPSDISNKEWESMHYFDKLWKYGVPSFEDALQTFGLITTQSIPFNLLNGVGLIRQQNKEKLIKTALSQEVNEGVKIEVKEQIQDVGAKEGIDQKLIDIVSSYIDNTKISNGKIIIDKESLPEEYRLKENDNIRFKEIPQDKIINLDIDTIIQTGQRIEYLQRNINDTANDILEMNDTKSNFEEAYKNTQDVEEKKQLFETMRSYEHKIREYELRIKNLEEGVELERESIKTSELNTKPSSVVKMKVNEIQQDPKRFQYKLESKEKEGGAASLTKATKWNENYAGVIQVWKDPENNKIYVVNGHGRLNFAKKLNIEDVDVKFIKANDYKEARSIGALTNFAEGMGTTIDAAKFIRDSKLKLEDLQREGIDLSANKMIEALSLSNLKSEYFNDVINEKISKNRGALLGKVDEDTQDVIMNRIEKVKKPITDEILEELIRIYKTAPKITVITHSLFGDITSEKSLDLEIAELSSYVKKHLKNKAKTYKFLSKEKVAEQAIESGVGKIETKIAKALGAEAAVIEDLYNRLATYKGELSKVLTDAAEQMSNTKNKGGIKNSIIPKIEKIIEKEYLKKEIPLFEKRDPREANVSVGAEYYRGNTEYESNVYSLNSIKAECLNHGIPENEINKGLEKLEPLLKQLHASLIYNESKEHTEGLINKIKLQNKNITSYTALHSFFGMLEKLSRCDRQERFKYFRQWLTKVEHFGTNIGAANSEIDKELDRLKTQLNKNILAGEKKYTEEYTQAIIAIKYLKKIIKSELNIDEKKLLEEKLDNSKKHIKKLIKEGRAVNPKIHGIELNIKMLTFIRSVSQDELNNVSSEWNSLTPEDLQDEIVNLTAFRKGMSFFDKQLARYKQGIIQGKMELKEIRRLLETLIAPVKKVNLSEYVKLTNKIKKILNLTDFENFFNKIDTSIKEIINDYTKKEVENGIKTILKNAIKLMKDSKISISIYKNINGIIRNIVSGKITMEDLEMNYNLSDTDIKKNKYRAAFYEEILATQDIPKSKMENIKQEYLVLYTCKVLLNGKSEIDELIKATNALQSYFNIGVLQAKYRDYALKQFHNGVFDGIIREITQDKYCWISIPGDTAININGLQEEAITYEPSKKIRAMLRKLGSTPSLMTWDTLISVLKLGGREKSYIIDSISEELKRAERFFKVNKYITSKEIDDIIKKYFTDKEYYSINTKKNTLLEPDGSVILQIDGNKNKIKGTSVELTISEMMDIYAKWLEAKNRNQFSEEGKRLPSDIFLERLGYEINVINSIERDILKDNHKNFINEMSEYIYNYGENIQPLIEALTLKPFYLRDLYFPYVVDKKVSEYFQDDYKFNLSDMLRRTGNHPSETPPSFTKERKEEVKSRLKILGYFKTLNFYFDRMEFFKAFSTPLHNLHNITENPYFNKLLKQYFGNSFQKTFSRKVLDFTRGYENRLYGMDWLEKMRQRIAKSWLGLAFNQYFKAASSGLSILADIPSTSILQALLDPTALKEIKRINQEPEIQARKYNDFLSIEKGVGREITKDIIPKNILEYMLLPVKWGDGLAWSVGAYIGYWHYKNKMNLNEKDALDRGLALMHNSQASSDFTQISSAQATSWGRYVFFFQNQVIRMLNKIQEATINALNDNSDYVDYKKLFKVFLVYWVILPQAFLFASNGFSVNGDDHLIALLTGTFSSFYLMGDLLDTIAKQIFNIKDKRPKNSNLFLNDLWGNAENLAMHTSDILEEGITPDTISKALQDVARLSPFITSFPVKRGYDITTGTYNYMEQEDYWNAVKAFSGYSTYTIERNKKYQKEKNINKSYY